MQQTHQPAKANLADRRQRDPQPGQAAPPGVIQRHPAPGMFNSNHFAQDLILRDEFIYAGWGIATQLVGEAIGYAREQQMHTLLAEAPITNPILLVYLKAGFRVSGFIDAYHPPGREGPVTALFLAYDLG